MINYISQICINKTDTMNNVNHTDRTLVELLRELVISETRLAIATREAHWNVTGPAFFSLHELFGQQYATLDGFIDDIAERVRQLGQGVSGSPLMGATEISPDADELLMRLSEKHQKLEALLRKTIALAQDRQDEATADLLTGVLKEHGKMLWMLRASVQVKHPELINIPA